MQQMSRDEIESMLSDTLIGRLAMADREGRPYTIPLPFCWTQGALYLRLPDAGRKGKILAQNDRVCFEIDQFSDTLDEYASVLVEGRLIRVTDVAEKRHVKRINDEKYWRLRRGHRPGHGRAGDVAALPMKKVFVEHISGRKNDPPALAFAGCGSRRGSAL